MKITIELEKDRNINVDVKLGKDSKLCFLSVAYIGDIRQVNSKRYKYTLNGFNEQIQPV